MPFPIFEKASEPKWGYINGMGEIVITPQYLGAEGFAKNGMALVESFRGGDIVIDRKGNLQTMRGDYIQRFGNGYYLIRNLGSTTDGPYGLLDSNLEVIVSEEYQWIDEFANDRAVLKKEIGDRNGRWIFEPKKLTSDYYGYFYPYGD